MKNFTDKVKADMKRTFGSNWEERDSYSVYTFDNVYGKQDPSDPPNRIFNDTKMVAYMNDGRVLCGTGFSVPGERDQILLATLPENRPCGYATYTSTTYEIKDIMALVADDSMRHRDGDNVYDCLKKRIGYTAAAEGGKVEEWTDDDLFEEQIAEYPDKLSRLYGDKALIIDTDGNAYKGVVYFEDKVPVSDDEEKDGRGLLIWTGGETPYREISLDDIAEMSAETDANWLLGQKVNGYDAEARKELADATLREYRPFKTDGVPDLIFEARLKLISDDKTRDRAKSMCSWNKELKELFCGFSGRSKESGAPRTMLELTRRENNLDTCKKIFAASAYGCGLSEKVTDRMATEAMNITKDYQSRINAYNSNGIKEDKTPGLER